MLGYPRWLVRVVCASVILTIPELALAQAFVYPARGQSAQQQEFDRGQCYSWAVQQSGFDPANPRVAAAPPPQPGMPQGGLFRGAFGGAAMGAVGGAIGGDAGKGAAIGAAVGGLFGGMRRRRWAEEEQQQQQSYMAQQQNTMTQGHAAYNRAFGACMTGRGYSVSM
jgi:outer membrane protein with glycine zipper